MRLYFAAPSHSLNSKEEVRGWGGQNRRGKTYLAKGKITHLIEKTLTQQDGKTKKTKRRQNEVNKREQTDLPVIDSLLGAASKSVLLSASPLDAFKYNNPPPQKKNSLSYVWQTMEYVPPASPSGAAPKKTRPQSKFTLDVLHPTISEQH